MKPFGLVSNTLTFGVLFMGASILPYAQAYALDDNALPSGGNVVGGNASFDYATPNELHVHQSSDRAVIDWDSFNIGANALTQFHQNSSSSLVVNRVVGDGQDPTQILGTLRANGQVMVLDRNGVLFGANSVIDTGGIIASTGDVSNAAVMNGDMAIQITGADTGGQIINNGSMTVSEAGLAAFVAPSVINNGVISAKMGRVQLAAGSKATLDLYGDGLVELAVDAPLENALIQNTGTINAQGGTVHMTAAVAKNVVDTVINTSGVVNVASVTDKGGKIILEGANTLVSGTLDASGKTGGGKILVGGEYQGGGKTRHAETVNITDTAKIKANATGDHGDGGEVILWSDGTTQMDGTIEAKSGSASGNGGLVETSGKKNLGLTGSVDASGVDKNGEWLLDPSNVMITASGGNNIPSAGGTIDPATDSYSISASSIQAALNLGNNVTITTTNGSGTQAGNIEFDWAGVTINKTSGASATLTFKANAAINFNNAVIQSTGAGNALNIVGWADFDGTGNDGQITTYGTMATNGGNIYLVGGLDNGANGGTAGDGIGDNYATNTIVINSANINAQGGNIVINGSRTDDNGVVIAANAQVQTSGSGNITIRGIGTSSGLGWAGGVLIQGGASVHAATGTIDITGTNTSVTGQGVGILLDTGGSIYTTGATGGNINVTGTRTGATLTDASGITLGGDTARIYTNNGNITLNGTASTATNGVHAYGLWLNDGGDIYSTGSGTLSITGNASGTTGNIYDVYTSGANTTYLGDTASTGALTFNTNTMTLDNANTLVRSLGTVTVKPRTASTNIGLGGAAGLLNLTDAELAMFNAGTLIIGDSVSGTGYVEVQSWDLSGKTHNVEIYGTDINLAGLTLGSGNFTARGKDNGGNTSDINVAGTITKSVAGTSSLNLISDHTIGFHSGSSVITTNGVLNVVLNADRNADQAGVIFFSGGLGDSMTTNGGYVVMGGGSGTLWGTDGIKGTADDATSTGADKIAAYGTAARVQGIALSSYEILTGGGDIYMNGTAYNDASANNRSGIHITSGGTVKTTSGKIYMTGVGGLGTVDSGGISIVNTGIVSSATGLITLTGTSAAISGGWNNYGINLLSGGTIESTGTGASAANIILNGYNNSTSGGFILAAGSSIRTIDGDITIKSYAGSPTKTNNIDTYATATIESTGDGNITIETVGGNSGTNAINFDTGGVQRIGSATMTGDITLITNGLNNIQAADSIITQGSILIRGADNSTSIGLGGGSGTLNLDDTELGALTAGNKLIIGNSLSGTGDIDLDSWDLSGKTYSVELYGNDIDIGGVTLGTGNFLAAGKDNGVDTAVLNISAAITKSLAGTSSVTLRSDNYISANAGLTTTNGKVDLLLNSDYDNSNDGYVSVASGVTLASNGGNITIGGGSGTITTTSGYATGSAAQSSGVRIAGTVDAGGGNIIVNGRGFAQASNGNLGVNLNSGKIQTTGAGTIDINGIGGGTGISQHNHGVYLLNTNSLISAQNGIVTINGFGGNGAGTGGSNVGIYIAGTGSSIKTTGTGNLLLNGTGGTNGAGGNAGILGATEDAYMTSGAGSIIITATANGSNVGVNIGNPNTVHTSGTGNITILTDTLLMGGTTNTVNSAGVLTIAPKTTGTMAIGTTGSTLNISTAQLAYINGASYVFGSANAGNVTVQTGYDFGDKNVTFLSGANILLNSTLTKGSGLGTGTYTFNAYGNITNANSAGILSNAGSLNIVLNADHDANQDGFIYINGSTITTNGGNFIAGGGSGAIGGSDGILGNGDGTGADDVAAWGSNIGQTSGVQFSGSSISTGAGQIIINGHGNNNALSDGQFGVYLSGVSTLETTTGAITIRGTGGNGVQNNHGIFMAASGAGINVRSEKGAITFYGTGGSTNAAGSGNNYGIFLSTVTNIESLGTGADASTITMTGVGSGRVSGHGFVMNNTAPQIKTKRGTITITGTGSQTATSPATNVGIRMGASSSIIADGDATITLIANHNPNEATPYGFLINGTATIGGATATGTINLKSNYFDLTGADIRTTSAGKVVVTPLTASASIGLGGGAGTLNLDDTELAMFNTGTLIIGDSANGTGDIDLDTWDLSSKTHNVEIYGNDIDIGGLTLGTGNFTAHAIDNAAIDPGTLLVTAPITKSIAGTSSLTLRADRDIFFNNASNITATTGSLNVVLNADRDADQDGAIAITTSTISTNGGYFVAGGGSGTLGGANGILGDGDGTGADDVAAWGTNYSDGINVNGGSISTGAGSIYLTGHGGNIAVAGSDGIQISGNLTTTGNGNITIKGIGGGNGTLGGNYGVNHTAGTISTVDGLITINGTGGTGVGGGQPGSYGVSLFNVNSATGNIDITGTGSSGGTNRHGVRFGVGSGTINSGSGILNITATAGGTDDDIVWTSGTIGGAGQTGDININVNTFNNSGTTITSTGKITVKPRTSSTTIGLGGGTGTLNLTDAELDLFQAGTLIIGDSLLGTGDIDLDSWDISGKTHNVEIYGNDIDIGGLILGTGSFMAHAMDAGADLGTLNVGAPITKSVIGTSSLTLRADKDITFASGSNITTTNGILNIVLNADRDADQDGAISISSSTITTNGGYFVAGGGSGTLWGADGIQGTADDATSTGADNIAATGNTTLLNGISLNNADINTLTGTISLNGNSASTGAGSRHGVLVSNGSLLETTSGNINIRGESGNGGGAGQPHGVALTNTGTLLQTDTGAITIIGRGNAAASASSMGIRITDGAGISSTGINAGDIRLTGTGGGTSSATQYHYGIFISGTGTTTTSYITSENGDIYLNGTGGGGAGSSNNQGILFGGANTYITSTGTTADAATINLEGTSGAGTSAGLYLDGGNGAAYIRSAVGDISATASMSQASSSSFWLYSGETTIPVIESTGSANITLRATNPSGNAKINTYTAAAVGGSGMTGNLNIITDEYNAAPLQLITSATGQVFIKPYNTATTIGLGGGSGTLNFTDTELAGINTGTLIIGDSLLGTGYINVDTWDLSAKAHNVQVHGTDINIAGLTMGSGNVTFYAKNGAIQVNGNSISNASGNLSLLASHTLQINNAIANTGTGRINLIAGWDGTSGLTTPALFNIDDVDLGLTARNITLGTNASLSSAGPGTSVLIATSGAFKNNATAGVNAISAAGGRYLVYSENPTDTTKGGLTAKNQYNTDYNSNPASSIAGTTSRFIYKYQPTVTVTADDVTAPDVASAVYTYSVNGLINGDLAGDVLGGAANYSLGGAGAIRPVTVSGLSSLNGYAINYAGGTLTITGVTPPTPPPILVTPPSANIETPVISVISQSAQKERVDVKQEIVAASSDQPKETGCLVVMSGEGCVVH